MSGGGHGAAENGGGLRRGRRVSGGDQLRNAILRRKLPGRPAPRRGGVRPHEGRAGPLHGEHHAPQRRGRPPAGASGTAPERRGGCADRGGSGRVHAGGEVRAPLPAPHLHAGQHLQLRVRQGVVRAGGAAGDPGPGAESGRDPGDPGQNPAGTGTGVLRPRGHVRQLLRPVPSEQLYDRAGFQPGRLRPALPVSVRADGGKAAGGVFPGV